MSESAVVILCQVGGSVEQALSYAVLLPFLVFLGIWAIHLVVLDWTSMFINFTALWYTWGLFTLQAAAMRRPRPNTAVCPDTALFGAHSTPEPQGGALTVFALLWLLFCVRQHAWKRLGTPALSLLALTVLYWVGAYVNGYVDSFGLWLTIYEAALFSAVLDAIFERVAKPIIEHARGRAPWIGASNFLLPHFAGQDDRPT